MEATDWESASSGVWLRREDEEKKEEKEERLSVRPREEEKSKRRMGEEADVRGGVVMRREGSRQRREEDQRRRLSGPTRLREGGSSSQNIEGRGAAAQEAKIPSSERGLLPGPVARLASSRPNNPRPTSRVIEIKGRPMEHHQLQPRQGGQHGHQQHHQVELQQGHFASADSGISSLNTSTTGSRKSVRHTMIH